MPVDETRSLFMRLLGDSFKALPKLVQQVHDCRQRKRFSGRCVIKSGNRSLTRLLARLGRLPPPGEDVPITVVIERTAGDEIWTRNFDGSRMRSHLSEWNGMLVERVGLAGFAFGLSTETDAIVWTPVTAQILGIPLPASWLKGVTARESLHDGRYTFDVRAELPGLGLLIQYHGWLEPDD